MINFHQPLQYYVKRKSVDLAWSIWRHVSSEPISKDTRPPCTAIRYCNQEMGVIKYKSVANYTISVHCFLDKIIWSWVQNINNFRFTIISLLSSLTKNCITTQRAILNGTILEPRNSYNWQYNLNGGPHPIIT